MENRNKSAILGSRIAQRRKHIGYTQTDLAEKLGVSENQISNIENGRSFPTLKNFILICEVLECNADYLLSGLIRETVDKQIVEMVASLSLEEQVTVWKLLDCYIHRNDTTVS